MKYENMKCAHTSIQPGRYKQEVVEEEVSHVVTLSKTNITRPSESKTFTVLLQVLRPQTLSL